MPSLHHEVPTHLNVEDKLMLGLTARQFLYVLVGSSASYAMWGQTLELGEVIRALAVALCVATTLVFVLVRPAGRPLEEWLVVALLFRGRAPPGDRAAARAVASGLAAGSNRLAGADAQSGVGRGGPRVKRASVQSAKLGISPLQAGVVALTDGEYRAVVEVSGTASPFEDDARQEAVLAGYVTFLNALSYPIQILVRASPVDLSRYVALLEERARLAMDGQLGALAHDHIAFVQGLARRRTLLERRFYVIVPAEATTRGWYARFAPRRASAATDEPRREAAHRQLTFRCDDLARQFARCGLAVRRLADLELAQLFLACWSPERARAQRFRQQLDDYTTLVVRASQPGSAVD